MSRLVSDHTKLHNPLLGLENKLQIKISFQNWVFFSEQRFPTAF